MKKKEKTIMGYWVYNEKSTVVVRLLKGLKIIQSLNNNYEFEKIL